MVLKDLPKFQNVPSDVDVHDVSSITSDEEGGSGGKTKKKSSERGGMGAKAAKAWLAQAARRGAREDVLDRHFKRDNEHFLIMRMMKKPELNSNERSPKFKPTTSTIY